jgi:multidrug resistance efflux pump
MNKEPNKALQENQSPLLLLDELNQLNQFLDSPAEFLKRLLSVKSRASQAMSAVLVKKDEKGPQILALAPAELQEVKVMPDWLRQALKIYSSDLAEDLVTSVSIEDSLSGGFSQLTFIPMKIGESSLGMEIYRFPMIQREDLERRIERIQYLMPYFDFYEGRVHLKDYQDKTLRLHQACDILVKLNQSVGFLEAAMSTCNEVAARFSCSRVSLGFLKGKAIHLKSVSNTEKFKRKMNLLQGIEQLMEECLDQDIEVLYPQSGKGDYVARDVANYSKLHGPLNVLSLPLRDKGKVVAILTLERPPENSFNAKDIELFRLISDLFSPKLLQLYKYERWFGARIQESSKKTLSFVLGAKYTWLKLICLLVISLSIYLSQAKGTYQVESSFSFESKVRGIVVVPFNAEIEKIHVENGQRVHSGDELVQLDTTEEELELVELVARRLEAIKKMNVAMGEGKTAEAQIAKAEAAQSSAEIKLREYNINRAVLKAPTSGVIVADKLDKKLFSMAKFGETLIEVAQNNKLEAYLYVPEEQIADVRIGAQGELAAAGYPDRKIKFTVREINPVAEVRDQRNVFKVKAELVITEAQLGGEFNWVKLGMEGVARVDVEPRLYAWIWTRKAVNYLRMKFWI